MKWPRKFMSSLRKMIQWSLMILDERCCSYTFRIPDGRGQVRPSAVTSPAAMVDPGVWLRMVKGKALHLADLEIEGVKTIILDYKGYCQKCPRQSPREMHNLLRSSKSSVTKAVEKDELIQACYGFIRLIQVENGEVWKI